MHASSSHGFTLIELLVVMSLIIILSALAIVQYRQSVVRSREAVLHDDLFKMRDAIDQYYADKNQYPSTLDALVTDGYLRALPKDPFTDSASTWQTIQAEPDPTNPIGEAGVYDVKSGSDQTGLDGTPYADW
jgi:general secretion pathway protein G